MASVYGANFLIPLTIGLRGGNDAIAGAIISIAAVGTFVAVVFSGHVADRIGIIRTAFISGLLLAFFGFGFGASSTVSYALLLFGLILGIGWGLYYTLAPIIVAHLTHSNKRTHFFAILSGSMMAGIGTGPLLGRLITEFSWPVEATFIIAGINSILGALIYAYLNVRLADSKQIKGQLSRISFPNAKQVLSSNAAFSILLVGLGGCLFGGFSSFQTTYAAFYQLDYSLFFIGFILPAISARLFASAYVVKQNPYVSSLLLSSMTTLAMLIFSIGTKSAWAYVLASAIFGIGYGLTYSVINGLAASEAPSNLIPQSLLLFSLSYFIGIFCFPIVAGKLIVSFGLPVLMITFLLISLSVNAVCVYRLNIASLRNH